jgi:hypothetical protein
LNVDINHIGVQQMPKTNRFYAALFATVMLTVMMVPTLSVPAKAATPTAVPLFELA